MILAGIALVSAVGAVWYQRFYLKKEKKLDSSFLRTEKLGLVLYAAGFVLAAAGLVFLGKWKELTEFELVQRQLVWNTCLLIAVIDFKVKKIPNQLILFLLAVRLVFLAVECILSPSGALAALLYSLIGMLVGGMVLLASMLLSRGGVGAGDLKLFAACGFFFGLNGVMAIMMYSLMFAALASITLLVSRKAKMKSTLAMGPFVFLGLTAYFILS